MSSDRESRAKPLATLSRVPTPPLRPFVSMLWAMEGMEAPPGTSGRELVLPTGSVHLVFRLGDLPLRLFKERGDAVGRIVGRSVIGGARAGPYLRDVSMAGPSVGALLRPGAAELIVGAPAGALSHAHTPLEDVWGAGAVAGIRERLSASPSAAARIELLEAVLAARLPRLRGIDPLVAHALTRFGASCRVGDVVRDSGWSHRHFTAIFREAVGLGPKTYCRVLRFGRVLDRLASESSVAWADLAAAEGYADQPHFIREFREFAGLSPGSYRKRAPAYPRHVPV